MKLSSKIALAFASSLALVAPSLGPAHADGATLYASSAGVKVVGQTTSTWGSLSTAPNATAWTEVKIGGSWSRSQVSQTNASGGFTIPLTYGANSAGTTTWRVGVAAPSGTVYSKEFALTRLGVTANSAGTKNVGEATSAWGTANASPGARVWTQVNIGGKWSTSQVGTTSSTGSYTLPLTYGANSAGTTTWRVGVATPAGTAYSKQFTLTRNAPAAARTAASSTSLTSTGVGGTCKASYYWQGQRTANGERFNPDGLTTAHRTLPFNTRVKVTNVANGKSVVVRVNDRGPFISGRCLDVSRGAMRELGGTSAGVITAKWEVVR